MVVCSNCQVEVDEADINEAGGFSSCPNCGSVWDDLAFSTDPTFQKGADGEGEMLGQYVSETGHVRGLGRMAGGRYYPTAGDSSEAAASKGRNELSAMIDHFSIRPREASLEAALRLYKLALAQGFTKGRVVGQVAACCLYIICRLDTKPFMLLDYSDLLQVNVFVLGGVYLQLVELLRLTNSPALSKPVDPSLYLHRFTEALPLGDKKLKVFNTSMRLISSMKRDWMQTGRRPSGVCGAAIWLAAHIHGVPLLKTDVVRVVCVGWATLDKRLKEFTRTPVALLTPGEFESHADEAQKESEELIKRLEAAHETMHQEARKALPAPPSSPDEGCMHVVEHPPCHFAAGMCRNCFQAFLQHAGGLWGTEAADPPAFTAARDKEAAAEGSEMSRAEVLMLEAAPDPAEEAAMLAAEAGKGRGRGRGAKHKAGRGRGRGRRGRTKASALAGMTPGEEEGGGQGLDEEGEQLQALDAQLRAMKAQVAGEGEGQEKQQQQQQQAGEEEEEERQLGAGLAAFGSAAAIPNREQRTAATLAVLGKRPRPGSQAAGPSSSRGAAGGGAEGDDEEGAGAGLLGALSAEACGPEAMGAMAAGLLDPGALVADGEEEGEEEGPAGWSDEDEHGEVDLTALDGDLEVNAYIITDEDMLKTRKDVWLEQNADWLEKQEKKRQQQEEAQGLAATVSAVSAEEEAALQERVAAVLRGEKPPLDPLLSAAVGVAPSGRAAKQRRSSAKGKGPGGAAARLPEAATPLEAAQSMLDANAKLSGKVNYGVLKDLFLDTPDAGASDLLAEEGEFARMLADKANAAAEEEAAAASRYSRDLAAQQQRKAAADAGGGAAGASSSRGPGRAGSGMRLAGLGPRRAGR